MDEEGREKALSLMRRLATSQQQNRELREYIAHSVGLEFDLLRRLQQLLLVSCDPNLPEEKVLKRSNELFSEFLAKRGAAMGHDKPGPIYAEGLTTWMETTMPDQELDIEIGQSD